MVQTSIGMVGSSDACSATSPRASQFSEIVQNCLPAKSRRPRTQDSACPTSSTRLYGVRGRDEAAGAQITGDHVPQQDRVVLIERQQRIIALLRRRHISPGASVAAGAPVALAGVYELSPSAVVAMTWILR